MKDKQILTFIYHSVLIASIGFCFLFTWYFFYKDDIIFPFWRKGNWLVVMIYVFSYYLIGRQFHAFNLVRNTISNLIYANMLTLFFTNVFNYCIISLIGRYWLPLNGLLWMFLAEIIITVVWSLFLYHLSKRTLCGKFILIYDDLTNVGVYKELILNHNGCTGLEMLHTDLFTRNCLKEKMEENCKVYVACSDKNLRADLLCLLFDHNIETFFFPDVSDLLIHNSIFNVDNDQAVLEINNANLSITQRILKRAFDIIFSIVGFILFSPFFLIIPILIKREDNGSVFYSQIRETIGGKLFKLYKFRTMIDNAERRGGPQLSSKNDERITKIGAKLRRFRLDELPQLWNILKGDIALIGPRPERPELIEKYKKLYPNFNMRLKVKAGLTGYAQVYGKYSTPPDLKLLLDLHYIGNYSLLMDIRIFFMTIKTVFHKDSTD